MKRSLIAMLGLVVTVVLFIAPASAQAGTAHTREIMASSGRSAAIYGGVIKLPDGKAVYVRVQERGASEVARDRAASSGFSYVEFSAVLCNDIQCDTWSVSVDFHATSNGTRIWINGTPKCTKAGTTIGWCGYGNNGGSYIGVGEDFGPGGAGDYFRMYERANETCSFGFNVGRLGIAFCQGV